MTHATDEGLEYSDEQLDAIWAEFEALGDPDWPEPEEGLDGSEDAPQPRKNLKYTIDGDILRIEIDLTRIESESRSGRSWVIAGTSGNMPLVDQNGIRDEILNFSLTRRKEGAPPLRWYVTR